SRYRIGRGGASWPIGGVSLVPPNRGIPCSGAALRCVITVRAMTLGKPDSLGLRWVELGSRLLRLVVFTNPIRSFSLHNFGQSSHLGSPHYADQARLSSERRLKPMYFDDRDLVGHITSTTELDVRLR